ncbi:MAG: alkaline phosphatase family protein [Ignavibacteriales bacterium]|nr:alkaline phosphatase family protein [Ignavibacteriales bacterium]
MKRTIAFVSILFILSTGFLESGQRPKLVIFFSIDQMKAEYLEWYKAEFTGGFKRILAEGTQYTNADLNYAPSETGPGHATLGTGSYPMHSGITSNDWFDRKTLKQVYCVEDTTAEKAEAEGGGVSSKNLMVPALGDWLKRVSPASKVIAASIKDRAAILMAGQKPDCVFWYDRKLGHMVTSEFYVKEVPAWVRSFNANDWIARHLPSAWTKAMPESVYAKYGPDEIEGEMKWGGSTSFPHAFPADKRNEQIVTSPFGDVMILDFALEAVKSEKLGQQDVPDVLLVSLSCTDYIGHAFGGNSHEMVDQMIRLDRALGDFIANVEKLVGPGNILLSLSADHAAMPLPEYRRNVQHKDARRVLTTAEINPRIQALDSVLQGEFKTTDHIIQSDAFLNYAAAAASGIDSTSLERRVKDGLLKINGIADVYFCRDLADGNPQFRPYLGYYQRGYYPPRGRDFIIRPCEYCLLTTSSTGTTHGTPYRYDTHVPILFWGMGVKAQQVARVVHTVDIAPTIAKVLGISTPATVDGKSLKEIVK